MTDPVGRLITWVSVLLRPRGMHRRTGPHAVFAPVPSPPPPAATRRSLPSHRSPYGLPSVLDGAGTVAVRPYVTASWFQEGRAA
ncbi:MULTISPECIES: hypothetical protein [unclassified Streptomyces]|uniref:hypothetical protein n=1 Tax=unclassified Streptomyces TaxID=2593676 RepID=UPI000A1F7A71|nr:hypothetical protein [Streptomyces sp. 13-12-16]OSP45186.1 hypothetical protein B7767_00955 [Streptomyces sp. 13-12-16]